LFTEFEPVIDKFSVSTESEPSYSIPRVELAEWIFQCTLHELRTWTDIDISIDVQQGIVITQRLKTDVPSSLIAGKDANTIVKEMKENGFDQCVIAYVLSNYIPIPLNRDGIGELFHPQGAHCSDRTHRRYAATLLKAAAKWNIRLID
jgi:hypothetical protein